MTIDNLTAHLEVFLKYKMHEQTIIQDKFGAKLRRRFSNRRTILHRAVESIKLVHVLIRAEVLLR